MLLHSYQTPLRTPFQPRYIDRKSIRAFSEMSQKSGLVLEGGGMRGMFTIGVLDCFMDAGIRFPFVSAVSAGACNALSYISGQRGRARASTVDMLVKYQYIGLRHLRKHHSVIDFETIFHHIPTNDLPYDHQRFFASQIPLHMALTNCRTGRADYLSGNGERERLLMVARASSSLPYVCPIVQIDGQPYLDGGIVDSIPLTHAQECGYSYNVVVCTHEHGYRSNGRDHKHPHFIYTHYPRLRVVLSHRHALYNEQLQRVEDMEKAQRICVIRPQNPVVIGRFERNPDRLNALYEEGYLTALHLMQQFH